MNAGQQLALRSIDDYLGPGERRFFSRGYQRAQYDVHRIAVAVDEQRHGQVTAEADLHYPSDWSSKKDSVDLRPHLSTIDALVLGVQLAEIHLGVANHLDAPARRAARLRKIALRAGAAPQEELRGVRLGATLLRTRPEGGAGGGQDGWALSVYDCQVGSLAVRCTISHPVGAGPSAGQRSPRWVGYASLAEALGPGARRVYGEAFKQRRHSIEDIQVDLERLVASGTTRFSTAGGPPATEGLDGDTQPSVSPIDCFVVNLQLAQVLLYELDGLRREDSNTLWMMQSVLECAEAPQPLDATGQEPLPVRTSVVGKRLLSLRGGTWRSVDMRGDLAGIGLRCAFAHELPHPPPSTS